MKILFAPVGTYGDVAPIVAYAKHLKEAGHDVRICTSTNWKKLILRNNLTFISLPFDFKQFTIENSEIAGKPFRAFFYFRKKVNKINKIVFDTLSNIAHGYDVIIGTGVQMIAAHVAEAFKTPYFHIMFSPVWINSKNYFPPIIKNQNNPQFYNSILWKLFIKGFNSFFIRKINRQREIMGLPRISNVYKTLKKSIIISSDNFITKTALNDSSINQIPYVYFENNDVLEEKINLFLSNSKPNIYFGFGSMPGTKKIELFDIITKVALRLNCNVIVQKSWANLYKDNAPGYVLCVDHNLPHRKLFPKMDMIVHHGGSGTVHNAVRAGVPQLIIPQMLDQFYWGNIIFRNKLGPKPLYLNKLSEKTLFERMDNILNNRTYVKKSKELAKKVYQTNDFTLLNNIIGIKDKTK